MLSTEPSSFLFSLVLYFNVLHHKHFDSVLPSTSINALSASGVPYWPLCTEEHGEGREILYRSDYRLGFLIPFQSAKQLFDIDGHPILYGVYIFPQNYCPCSSHFQKTIPLLSFYCFSYDRESFSFKFGKPIWTAATCFRTFSCGRHF